MAIRRRYKAMNQAVKAKWLKALRGGRYKQGNGALTAGEGYCCLGVVCKVNRLTAKKYVTADEPGTESKDYTEFETACYLSDFGQKVVGLSAKTQKRLANMNDEGRDFKQIADWIERYL